MKSTNKPDIKIIPTELIFNSKKCQCKKIHRTEVYNLQLKLNTMINQSEGNLKSQGNSR